MNLQKYGFVRRGALYTRHQRLGKKVIGTIDLVLDFVPDGVIVHCSPRNTTPVEMTERNFKDFLEALIKPQILKQFA